jgi:hypothetical protein
MSQLSLSIDGDLLSSFSAIRNRQSPQSSDPSLEMLKPACVDVYTVNSLLTMSLRSSRVLPGHS